MKEHENNLNPEEIDRQTEGQSDTLSPEESRLIQHLYARSQAYARENERSLERIWQRLAERQEQPALPLTEPGARRSFNKGKAMQERDFLESGELPILDSRPTNRPRRSIRHAASIIGAVAVVAIMVLGWALLTYGLRHGTPGQTGHGGQTSRTSVAQQHIHTGTLLCSFSDSNNAVQHPQQSTLDWSTQGLIAATYLNLEITSGHNCSVQSAYQRSLTQASWSPDGKRLLALDSSGTAQVLNASTGKVIASFKGGNPFDTVNQSVWSSDGTQAISEVTQSDSTISVQVWNASNGKLIRTAVTFPTGAQFLGLSSGAPSLSTNGKYVAVQLPNHTIEIWSVATGKQVSTIPYNQQSVSALGWSPDGTSLAIGLWDSPEVQIWSTATGKLSFSFKDNDTWAKVIGWLAWSPDGKYLAESASAIHIWDVKARKIVATFGKVDKSHWVLNMAWSSDGSMLASSTVQVNPPQPSSYVHNTVNAWKLS